jgi:branched-chain amino acid transport system permease protein
MGPATLIDMSNLVIFAIVGCSVVVLTGWLGQVSLAQLSFAAVGATTGAVALQDWGLDLSLALLVAGAAAGLICLVVGLPTLRMEGMFVAVTTLAFGLAASGYLFDRADFGWIPSGYLSTPRLFGVTLSTEPAVFEVCLGVGILVLVGLHGLRRSRAGRALRALAENERAAAGFGIHGARTKLWGFALSGFVAGVAGCLLVVVSQQYNESSFTVSDSLVVFAATVVGGLASPVGAVLGAALVEGSALLLPAEWQVFPAAFGVLVVLLVFPGGIAGALFSLRDRAVRELVGAPGHGAPAPA